MRRRPGHAPVAARQEPRSGGVKSERPRYWMLETIRELAAEQLAGEGETPRSAPKHAEHYLVVALSANLAPDVEGQMRHDLVIPERDNMRAALAWASTTPSGPGARARRGARELLGHDIPHEGLEWARCSARRTRPIVPDGRLVRALRVQGGMENVLGQPELAGEHFEQALAMARELGDELGVAILLHRLANTASVRGRHGARARVLAEESLAAASSGGFRRARHRR